MKQTILVLLFAILSTPVFAQDTWVGYKPIEEISAPHKETAMQVVVKMSTVTLAEEPNSFEVVDTYAQKQVTKKSKLESDYRVLQIETCRNQGLERCPVFSYSYNGTAFINKGREIFTCRHMLHDWVRIAAKENETTQVRISPPMWLTDNDKKIIYNSATSKNLISITINEDPRLDFVLREKTAPRENKEDLLYYQSEFASMNSPVDIGNPIQLSIPGTSSLAKGEQVYFSGFPAKTSYFGGPKKGDTPGKIMVSSTGKLIAVSTSLQLFLSDNLGTGGMSGGMVTDAQGGVIGIFCRSDDITDPNVLMSTSLLFDPLAQLKLWEHLAAIPLDKLTL